MFDRKFWDDVTPDGHDTLMAAYRAAKNDLNFIMPIDQMLTHGLRGIAAFTEADRFAAHSAPEWSKIGAPEYESGSQYWPISTHGLEYKNSMQYMTNAGWPAGTQCWFVTVECGWREAATALTPELALQRGIILMAAALEWRNIRPSQRVHMHDVVRGKIAPKKGPDNE